MHRREISMALFASAAGAALLSKDAEAQTCTAPCYARTAAEIAAGITPTNLAYVPGDVRRYGADPSGTSDSAAAFATAGSLPGAVTIPPGTYTINTNITVGSPTVFSPGAIIKPASGRTITLSSPLEAGICQIFDLSSGGVVALPRIAGNVYAEWWGAAGDLVKTDNEVPINQAIAALAVAVGGTFGGHVLLDRGDFYISDGINLTNQISLTGVSGQYPVLWASPGATFSASGGRMVTALGGTTSMFNSRIENLRINAGGLTSVVEVVYSNAWQEKCGLRNVVLENFTKLGFHYDTGIGGACALKLSQVECFLAASALPVAAGIKIEIPLSVGWIAVDLDQITVAGASANQANVSGIWLDGRIIGNCNAVHFENCNTGFELVHAATLTGSGVTGDGGGTCTTVITCSGSWNGTINGLAFKKAGSANFIVDNSRGPYALANVEPANGFTVWPPDPSRAVSGARVVGGATPSISYQTGVVLSVTHPATGQYRFTLGTSMDATVSYDVIAVSDLTTSVAINSATQFDVFTRTPAGALADCNAISVKVYHGP